MALVPASWMPLCSMKRVVVHWTAGRYDASGADRRHYHILVQGDQQLVRGDHSIEDNVSTSDGRYAAHTRNCNTGSIGVALCCMSGAEERPFRAGDCPLKRGQWETAAEVVAELCRFYSIPVTPRTVLAHGEVEANLGIPQLGKWDPLVLPWQPDLTRMEAAQAFRGLVQRHLDGAPEVDESFEVSIVFRGKERGSAVVTNGGEFVLASELERLFGVRPENDSVTFNRNGHARRVRAVEFDGKMYFESAELAEAAGMTLRWSENDRVVFVE